MTTHEENPFLKAPMNDVDEILTILQSLPEEHQALKESVLNGARIFKMRIEGLQDLSENEIVSESGTPLHEQEKKDHDAFIEALENLEKVAGEEHAELFTRLQDHLHTNTVALLLCEKEALHAA